MNLAETPEHYVTIFDSNFLVSGLALHESLTKLGQPFRLWIIGTDSRVVEQLESLALPNVVVTPVAGMETDALRVAKRDRSVGEYCWTLTPFAPEFVFERAPGVERVTYVDSDLFFFRSPSGLLEELNHSGKDVLITEHGYAPENDRTLLSGRFCVQFMTFRNTPGAQKVMRWWQERCLEWCFARYENGKYGDQKYLDIWPELFDDEVHTLRQTNRTLAPWNVDFFSRENTAEPVFFHFQGFRILSLNRIKLYQGYRVSRRNMWIYESYLNCIDGIARRLAGYSIPLPTMPEHSQRFRFLKYAMLRLLRKIEFVDPRFCSRSSAQPND